MARLSFCALCLASEGLEHHHVIPRSEGGSDEPNNILTVCHACHGKIHGMRRRADIGSLTKAALAASKARGVVLGGYRGGALPDSAKGVAARQKKAAEFAESLTPIAQKMRDDGLSLRAIAAAFEQQGIRTARGGTAWTAIAVSRLLPKQED